MSIGDIKKFADKIPHNWLATGFAVACFVLYMTNRDWLKAMKDMPEDAKEIKQVLVIHGEQLENLNDHVQDNSDGIKAIQTDQDVEHMRVNKHLELIESKMPNGEITGGIREIEKDVEDLKKIIEQQRSVPDRIDGHSINLEQDPQPLMISEQDEIDNSFICWLGNLFK